MQNYRQRGYECYRPDTQTAQEDRFRHRDNGRAAGLDAAMDPETARIEAKFGRGQQNQNKQQGRKGKGENKQNQQQQQNFGSISTFSRVDDS